MSLTLGIGGLKRHACVALHDGRQLLGACEQERVTRVRAAGANISGLPDEALDFMLARLGRHRPDVRSVAAAEPLAVPPDRELSLYDHHLGHAAAAYLTSPVDRALVMVCDHQPPELSVWQGEGGRLTRTSWDWTGAGFGRLYSASAGALGFQGRTPEVRLEALARLQPVGGESTFGGRLRLADGSIDGIDEWLSALADAKLSDTLARGDVAKAAAFASAVQQRIGDLLLDVVSQVRRSNDSAALCLAGSLFFNSNYCARIKRSGLFDTVFVPVNPGNAGLAIGTALLSTGRTPQFVSPFVGPAFDSSAVKATLDNCKLTYEWVGEHAAAERAVDALIRGRLVGWFDGPMESGPKALGARCILANPLSPYVLENLNRFLKHREPWRGYALSVLNGDAHELFEDAAESPFMECDFHPRDRERFRHVLPHPTAAVRVQTAGSHAPPPFQALLRLFGQASGAAVLVNTSFNGFLEPIVCTPRDAVRVFYGTGLDMLVMGGFVLTK